MTTLGALPFLLLVVIALPGLAALTGRRLREMDAADISTRAVYLQTVLTQAVITALGLLALRVTGLTVELVGRVTSSGVTAAAALVTGALALSAWHRRLGKDSEKVAALLRPRSALDRVLWIGVLAVVAVAEEFAYRGVLFVLLRDVSGTATVAAIASATVFGLAHLAQGWAGAALSALFGLAFQAVAVLSGGLGVAIAAHFVYDLSVELIYGEGAAGRQGGKTAG
jgi:membrane protease YdiL (CAAX protease family)